MLTWNDAPKDATHQHVQSKMFYKVEDTKVQVWSAKNGWSKSKVTADSSNLMAKPQEESQMPEVKVIEASSIEELTQQLSALGLPQEVITEMTSEVAGQMNQEETCECNNCIRESIEAKKAALLAETESIKVDITKAMVEGDSDKVVELSARLGEILKESIELVKEASEANETSDSMAKVDAMIERVKADIAEAGRVPANEKEFKIYAGMIICSLVDMGLLDLDAE